MSEFENLLRGHQQEQLQLETNLEQEITYRLASNKEENNPIETGEDIKTIDAVDYLKGYSLPPDDDRIFDPSEMEITTTYLSNPPHQTVKYIDEFGLTNREVRAINSKAILDGGKPVLITRAERDQRIRELYSENLTLGHRFKRAAGKMIGLQGN